MGQFASAANEAAAASVRADEQQARASRLQGAVEKQREGQAGQDKLALELAEREGRLQRAEARAGALQRELLEERQRLKAMECGARAKEKEVDKVRTLVGLGWVGLGWFHKCFPLNKS